MSPPHENASKRRERPAGGRAGSEDFVRSAPSPAPTRRARQPFRRLRLWLLALGVLAVAVLVLLLVAYNFGRTELGSNGDPDTVDTEGVVSLAEQVRFSRSSDGKPIFEVRAASERQDEKGVSHLEKVQVEFFRDDGASYTVTSERATLDRKTLAALFEGDVRVRGWRSLELDARAIEISRGGDVITSRGAVDFRWLPTIEGRASELRIDRVNDVIKLHQGVHLRTVAGVEPALRLDAQQLFYNRQQSLVRATDDVRLRRDDQELTCRVLTFFLEDDQETVKLVRARFGVEGRVETEQEDGSVGLVTYSGEMMESKPTTNQPDLRFTFLEGTPDAPARVVSRSLDGLRQSFVADRIDTRSRAGKLIQIEGLASRGRPVELMEYLEVRSTPYVIRRACSDRITAGFQDDGALSQVFLQGQVELQDGRRSVTGGDTATLNVADESLVVEGASVEVFDDRGQLFAPRFEARNRQGILEAEGGVQAVLAESNRAALAGTPLGQGDGPINVQSERAVWTRTPATFAFVDDVRAWQGENLLLTGQLRGDQAKNEMSAAQGVVTLWTPANGSVKRPVEVRADSMSYRQSQGQLLYSGNVRMTADERKLSCREMVVRLGPGGRGVEQMTCTDDVELIDPVGGKRVRQGELAVYGVAADIVEVYGEKVELTNADGSQLVGKYLRYDLAAGSSRLSSQPPEGSPWVPKPPPPQPAEPAPTGGGDAAAPGADRADAGGGSGGRP